MKNHILNIINSNTGIKEIQLAMRVMEYIDPSSFSDAEFHHTLATLVGDGSIIAINYKLPSMTYRVKTMYFPKGTEIEGMK